MSELVSIVLPTRDGGAFLDESIGSIAAQTHEGWELIVVDDASRDATGEKADAWAAREPRIRVVHLARNRGLPGALNEGFRLARGAYFSWTSDDNAYHPEALARLLAVVRAGADVAYADYELVDAQGRVLRRVPVGEPEDLVAGNRVGACFLYRREVDRALGGYDESMLLAEDLDFWLRASRRFRLVPLHEPLYRYRRHAESLSAREPEAVCRAHWRAVKQHLEALDRDGRARALARIAAWEFSRGESRQARRHLLRALREGRRPLLYPGRRSLLVDLLLGPRAGSLVRRGLGFLARLRGELPA
jgi:glycosyltransferase involved in cell wall biosynthesis